MGAQGVIHPKDVIITLLSSHKIQDCGYHFLVSRIVDTRKEVDTVVVWRKMEEHRQVLFSLAGCCLHIPQGHRPWECETTLKGRLHGRTRGYFTSYFCTCTTFSPSDTYKSTCVCTSTTSSNHVGFFVGRTRVATMYKCTSLLYSDGLIIIAGVSNQIMFLQDIHYKLFNCFIY